MGFTRQKAFITWEEGVTVKIDWPAENDWINTLWYSSREGLHQQASPEWWVYNEVRDNFAVGLVAVREIWCAPGNTQQFGVHFSGVALAQRYVYMCREQFSSRSTALNSAVRGMQCGVVLRCCINAELLFLFPTKRSVCKCKKTLSILHKRLANWSVW